MTALDARKQIQTILHVGADGTIGKLTLQALNHLCDLPPDSPWPLPADTAPDEIHSVLASDFADPSDVRRFKACKAEGKSDQECFKVGDNALGFGVYDTSQGSGPCCALPVEDWMAKWKSERGAVKKKVKVSANGNTVICELRDTMPHRANIQNGCGIDLNPDACAVLGLALPIKVAATWQWIDESAT